MFCFPLVIVSEIVAKLYMTLNADMTALFN